jgi:peptidoglycan/xylan/chitin deacetylase (PgdA/CDA1 family)
LLILTYHAIHDTPSPVSSTAAGLVRDIDDLDRAGFAFVSLDELLTRRRGGKQERIAAVTFDDGYASVATEAAPILQRRNVPATVFVIPGRLGKDNVWAGQWTSIPRMPLATAEQIRWLSAQGFAIAAHSMTHPVLPSLPERDAREEIARSGDVLEELTGVGVRYFAYPYGVFGEREVALVRERYDAAFTAAPAVVNLQHDVFALPRVEPRDLRLAARLGLLGSPALSSYVAARAALRRVRRTLERRR